ncbi:MULTISPECIES: hypothetical protein [Rhodococcus]|uniref:Uncharacterized protein n=1 Tax=Rhodococcus pseudokoreensis TaxID=2811421 RepID=A0A974ZXB1_9NOCA|nr:MULTISPECIES: hypothetical protein [Rhodococcus]MBV6762193.1 hypothetical protein [Rhodococcus opacus]QSE93936.1 hypothetical protein JWS13_37730 [Rhodococcus pseudokoreensis]
MSEYQYFEFLALDTPLSKRMQSEVRKLSTRAVITPTTFTNTYHFGDFRGDPRKMVHKCYDLHIHVTSWGTRRLMVKVPAQSFSEDAADYTVEPYLEVESIGKHLVFDFTHEDDSADFTDAAEGWMASLARVRDEMMMGDVRPLYLGWLAAIGTRQLDGYDEWEHEREPSVPAGLEALTAPQEALTDYLRIDTHLLAAAREASSPLASKTQTTAGLRRQIAKLPEATKNKILLAVAKGEHAVARTELARLTADAGRSIDQQPRTVVALLERADQLRQSAHPRRSRRATR